MFKFFKSKFKIQSVMGIQVGVTYLLNIINKKRVGVQLLIAKSCSEASFLWLLLCDPAKRKRIKKINASTGILIAL